MTAPANEVLTAGTAPVAGRREPSARPNHVQNILVAIDFTESSKAALNYATFLAEAFGATLTLAHVAEPLIFAEDLAAGLTIEQLDSRWIEKQKENMEALRHTIKEGIPETVVVTMGGVCNQIIAVAKSWNADLIVMGTHGPPWKHSLLGSTAERVVRHASCPVVVVPSPSKA
jgi:nucleotide-binding universal stress UspA family protein